MYLPRSDDGGFPEHLPGDAGSTPAPGVGTGSEGGALGSPTSSVGISTGGLVAIIVVVVAVAVLGATMGMLFFIAKKREWTMRETLRRSARKVKTVLTPRRTEFPSSVKDPESGHSRRGHTKLSDDIPPTPRLRPEDIEKASSKNKVVNLIKGRK